MDKQQVDYRIDKALVTSALEKLGSERVMRGHVALEHGDAGDWRNCFLAMCFGGFGVLADTATGDPNYTTAEVLGLRNQEVWAVVEAFDHCRAELQVLVEEWLELNYAPAVTA